MKEFKIDPKENISIDTLNLEDQFRWLPTLMREYGEEFASVGYDLDLAKTEYDEVRSEVYKELKSSGEKITENHISSLITTDERVKEAKRTMLNVKRDYDTIKSYIDSLKAKKDMLIQLGASQRKGDL